ncbi:TIR-like protein FxsC [Streptomyces gilvus]|uniref:TIR-like protein FxsC n=1 Tax=Streptomyces gilvus TaxID=2920937 RepID=UPI001F10B6F9|nr:TIR-like protein FxsC [Streptomyces sp. CME 23]MCH5672686.1 TIR-like protein FxsC [Streptomyces sp. CME 23]
MRVDAEDPRNRRPYFFLSYAHTPRNDSEVAGPNAWVKKLYDGLCAHILEMTSLPVGARAGFLDQGMALGTRWTDELSENLARCQVFVPLYSPRYFISEQCGREWWAFSQREIYRHTRRGESRESAIVPALWVPVEVAQLPQVAKDLQFQHADFGEDYAAEGFYGLTKLSYLKDQYERAVYRLAQRIVRASRAIDLEEGQIYRDYESLPSAFGDTAHPPGFDVTVLARCRSDLPDGRVPDYYGETPTEWNPYHPVSTRSLVEHAADLVRAMNFRVTVSDFENEADRLLSSGPPTAPVLLLLDRWALDSPRVKELMAQLAERRRPWISVMIPQHKDDAIPPERDRQLQELTDRLLATRQAAGSGHRSPGGGIRTLEAFSVELQKAVRQAVSYFEAHAMTYPPKGPPADPPWLPRQVHPV